MPLQQVVADRLRPAGQHDPFGVEKSRAQIRSGYDLVAPMIVGPWAMGETFTLADLHDSAVDYRQEPLDVALLWGVETWLEDPVWLAAGKQAIGILRAP